ncbi:ZIP family metal transporter [Candidatus Woesearchaeota archaeon]|nr:ZIP family metal transporter [Candidatus Woesearchaeota archaeon]
MLLAVIISTVIISLISLVGLFLAAKRVQRWIHYFISFAAGTLLAVSFFDLIPESLHAFEEAGVHGREALLFVLVGIALFFIIERFIHWHHCGKNDCDERPAGLLILTGDFIHNFLDGVLIASAYLLDFRAGLLATISIIAHEIPQEIGDFSVLLHAGYTKAKALLLNFYSALSAVIGGVVGYFLFSAVEIVIPFVVAVAAGGFIYIALTDIVPALHRHKRERWVSVVETAVFLLTIVVFWCLLSLLGHAH